MLTPKPILTQAQYDQLLDHRTIEELSGDCLYQTAPDGDAAATRATEIMFLLDLQLREQYEIIAHPFALWGMAHAAAAARGADDPRACADRFLQGWERSLERPIL